MYCIARGITEKSQSIIFAAEKLSASEWKFASDLRGFHQEALWQSASLELSVGFIPALNDNQANAKNKLVAQKFTLVQRLIAELGQTVSHFLTSMEYLGPIRPEPERIYTLEPLLRQRLRQRGLSAWLDFLLDQADDEQLLEIDQWLQRLGLGEEVAKE